MDILRLITAQARVADQPITAIEESASVSVKASSLDAHTGDEIQVFIGQLADAKNPL